MGVSRIKGLSVISAALVIFLMVFMAAPGFADDLTDDAAAVEAPADEAAAEEAPAEEAPAEEAPAEEAAEEEAAPIAKPAAPVVSNDLDKTTSAKRSFTKTRVQLKTRSLASTGDADSDVGVASVATPPVDSDFGITGGTANFNQTTNVTTFTWTVTCTNTHPDHCANESVSHFVLDTCYGATLPQGAFWTPAPNGGHGAQQPTGAVGWKWEGNPPVGFTVTLTVPGNVPGGGTATWTIKKGNDAGAGGHSGTAGGPNCTPPPPPACTSWSLSVDITNTGVGTGTVSDNHGNSTSTDATWTYNSTQKDDVDITATGTGGSTASNSGASNVAFSAHPNCNATYTVTFDKTDPVCTSWSLSVDITNSGVGTGTVSDNHGNTTSGDATWTYNSTQKDDVDITATGTAGSAASNAGASNVAFSAHPNCNATYTVTFSKTPPQIVDCDNDGIDDAVDPDTSSCNPPIVDCDADGIDDAVDPDTSSCNPPIVDCDADGIDDAVDPDTSSCNPPPFDQCPEIPGNQDPGEDCVLGEIITKPPRGDTEVLPGDEVLGSALPFTGTDPNSWLLLALILISLGTGMLALLRESKGRHSER